MFLDFIQSLLIFREKMYSRCLKNIKPAYFFVDTLIMFYKQRFISNDFLTSLFLKIV